jgi:transcriptional regulator with XRE-family HTH domain
MASQKADEMVRQMAEVLKERRLKIGASMNALASSSCLDRAALHRAEAGDRIPSLAFWVDWADTLGVSLENVMAEARKRAGKEAGKPPERKPLS